MSTIIHNASNLRVVHLIDPHILYCNWLGPQTEQSVKESGAVNHWNPDDCVITKQCPDAKPLNEYLMLLKAELTRRYNILLTSKEVVTACDVRDNYKGIAPDKKSFFELYSQFSHQLTERKEIDESTRTAR